MMLLSHDDLDNIDNSLKRGIKTFSADVVRDLLDTLSGLQNGVQIPEHINYLEAETGNMSRFMADPSLYYTARDGKSHTSTRMTAGEEM